MALHTQLLVAYKAAAPAACMLPAAVAVLPGMAVVAVGHSILAGSHDTREVAALAVAAVAHFVSQSWQLPGNSR